MVFVAVATAAVATAAAATAVVASEVVVSAAVVSVLEGTNTACILGNVKKAALRSRFFLLLIEQRK